MPTQPKALKLHAEARAELLESVVFYRERAGERWAGRFKQRVAEGLRAIAANPERYPPAQDLPGLQKMRIKQFPFTLLYVNRKDYIWIVAVAHGSRKPGYWKDRIS
ncbi:MAG: type toxin-antitoxin system RelE/ParE family toxin [Pedosphaera sp.]|nr:type toxin-antitoxin system RelE/ParE family toxin [Pedosphaera sp.]